jgi:hypothetical protein
VEGSGAGSDKSRLRCPWTPFRKSHRAYLVIPTGAKRSGGICSCAFGRDRAQLFPPLATVQGKSLLSPCHPDRSEAQRRDLQLRFRSQQNPTFSAPGHRSGKPLLSPFVIPTGAEGSAVALQVSTKPHLLRPWPPFREATALTLSSRPERRDLQLPSRSNEAAPFFPSNQGTRRNSVYTFPTLKCTLQRRKR